MNNQDTFLKVKLNLIFLLIVGFVIVDLLLELEEDAYMHSAQAAIFGTLLFLPYNRTLKNYLLHIVMMLIVLSSCMVHGGIMSATIYFFLSPIMSAYLSFGKRIGRYFIITALICVIALFIGSLFELTIFSQIYFSKLDLQIFTFSIVLGVGVDMIVTIINFENVKYNDQLALLERQKEIIVQEEELKQKQVEIIAIQEEEIQHEKLKKEQHELDKIKAENSLEAIQNSIEYASKIQFNTLPSDKVLRDYFAEYYIYYKPKDNVGGDYYYVNSLMGTTVIALIDCYNEGLTGMLLGSVIISYLDTLQTLPTRPSELIYDLHQYVRENFDQYSNIHSKGANLSIVYVEGNYITYSGANGIGYIVKDGNVVKMLSSDRSIGQVVNAHDSIPYMDKEYEVSSDDVIVLSTDGFIKQKNKEGEEIGEHQLEEMISGFYQGFRQSWKEKLDEYINENFANEQEDDISVLCFNLT